ncbi:MAG: hypothetical protein ABF991_00785 [Liquorilactobacillus hordei]|uniref:hypothetical protein n=1 Tax=Liquorilactobacillus hordei TaxID=468911 RepID=UPI0039EA3585
MNRKAQNNYRNTKRQRLNVRDVRKSNLQFADALADPRARISSTTSATTSKTNILTYLKNPKNNVDAIAATMRNAYNTNGLITRIIDYYLSIPTCNYSLYPVLGNKQYDLDATLSNDYVDVGYGFSQFNLKYFVPYFLREMFINGVSYFYLIQDTNGVEYMEFPTEWCEIYGQSNGVFKFMLDMSKFSEDTIAGMPSEISTAYSSYSSGNTSDPNSWYNGKFYKLSDNGVAFTIDLGALNNGGKAISPFSGLLLDSVSMDQAKSNVEVQDTIDNIRIIHSKIPLNSDGKPTMDVKTAKIYDTQIRNRLPSGVVAVTSPNNLTNVSMAGGGVTSAYDTLNKSSKQIFYDTGVSEGMFGGSTTSANIVKESERKDANWLYGTVFPMLENYYNMLLQTIKVKSKVSWRFKLIRQSNATLKDDLSFLKDQLTLGGSRLEYLAACGLEPIEIISKLQFEQNVLNIDDLMVVKPTSNTLSGSQQNNTNTKGRPETDEPTDDTDRLD